VGEKLHQLPGKAGTRAAVRNCPVILDKLTDNIDNLDKLGEVGSRHALPGVSKTSMLVRWESCGALATKLRNIPRGAGMSDCAHKIEKHTTRWTFSLNRLPAG